MMLRVRALVIGIILAVPVAILAVRVMDRQRTRDLELAVARVVRSQVNAQVRERCESDPRWFLTGPLDGRPPAGTPPNPDPDALPPRPKVSPQPFELFAYDEDFTGSSSAAPRFPNEFRYRLQAAAPEVIGPHETEFGTGVQFAVPTGWIGSPCMYFLGRMEPQPDQASARRWTFLLSFAVAFGVALVAAAPMVLRVRKLSRLAQESKNDGFSTLALDARKDELNAVTFVYNDAVNELRHRKARIDDLDAGLRRLVQSTEQEIAGPLRELEQTLASLPAADSRSPSAFDRAYDLSARVENLIVAARLRMTGGGSETSPIDVNALVKRIVARHGPAPIEVSLPSDAVTIQGDPALVERAVANVVDNAVRYSRPHGSVAVRLTREPDGRRFRLRVSDTGPGMSEEAYKALTAIRRFRGDEHRNRRPGAPGLGLAVAKEVADRFGLQLELRRPEAGGFEAEFSGPITS
jgi:signal transduction histidine kinase